MSNNMQITSAALMDAIAGGLIEVHYQPQMFSDGSAIAGVEALVRMRIPDNSLIGPANFLPSVETDAEHLHKLGMHVLKTACEDAKRWPGITIAVNIAPLQFILPGFADDIRDIVQQSGIEPNRIELEILESSWFEDSDKARNILRVLRTFGLRIAMDDFGTGYASLGALLEMPLDKLKIDRSFVTNCLEIKPASIIHAIVALARAIGLRVTAEGVETKEQARFLRTAGCHYLQGHYFSGAVSAAEISAALEGSMQVPRKF
jgi:EAL domain-containing protein (putative c-di-GMP-specific phosphodiesterase class I)